MHTHSGERENYVRDFVMVDQGSLRTRMEAAIESMLALLDELDGDTDRDPDNDDEPNLGWEDGQPNRHFFVTPWDDSIRRYDDTDREQDAGDEPEGPDTDREYTALERGGCGFAYSGHDDAEDSHDAEEGDDGEEDCRSWPLDDYPLDQTPVFIGGRQP